MTVWIVSGLTCAQFRLTKHCWQYWVNWTEQGDWDRSSKDISHISPNLWKNSESSKINPKFKISFFFSWKNQIQTAVHSTGPARVVALDALHPLRAQSPARPGGASIPRHFLNSFFQEITWKSPQTFLTPYLTMK